MNELENVGPEVRKAVALVDFYFNDGAKGTGWPEVRGELLRLAEDLHYANGVASLAMQHRDAAEAELAAIKARIAEAPVATLVISSAAGDLTLVWAENPDDWASKRVRLLVDEPPAERGEG